MIFLWYNRENKESLRGDVMSYQCWVIIIWLATSVLIGLVYDILKPWLTGEPRSIF